VITKLRDLAPSIIRTLVPLVVQFVTAQLTRRGIDPGPYAGVISQLVGVVVAATYYAAVRILETRGRQAWGWLLGKPGAPTYAATARKEPLSPTGEVAAPESLLPEGTPVETVPLDDPGPRFTGSAHLRD
jgi:hypothetical protein